MGRFRLSNSSRMSKVNKILPLSAAYVNAGQRLIVANEEGTPQLTDGYQLSTNVICGQVVEIADRDGYKGILVDDSSGLIVLKDYKEDREPLQIGDFIKAFGGMRKPKGAENGNLYFTPYEILKLGEQEADEISLKVLEQIVGQLNFSKRGSSTANNAGAQKMETQLIITKFRAWSIKLRPKKVPMYLQISITSGCLRKKCETCSNFWPTKDISTLLLMIIISNRHRYHFSHNVKFPTLPD